MTGNDPARTECVLVLSPNWLGDAVMALPAIADLRRRFAAARLVVAARRSVAELFTMAPGVDDVVTLTWRGSLRDRKALGADVAALKTLGAGIAVLLPNAFSAAWLASRAGVRERWGYARDFRRWLLTHAAPPPRRSMHQAEYYQHLVRQFGVETGALEPELTVPGDAIVGARMLLQSRGWDSTRPLVAIAPGAAYGTAKRWVPAHYASAASSLVEAGAQCVLVGSGGDRETTEWILELVPFDRRRDILDLTGVTTLPQLVGVVAIARAFVSNDSGAMHVAAAVGTPVTAIFGPTREYETRPLPRAGARVDVLIHPVWCRPCMLRECPIDHRCMKGVPPDRVVASVRDAIA